MRETGQLACMVINDLDAGVGRFKDDKVTVNNQAGGQRLPTCIATRAIFRSSVFALNHSSASFKQRRRIYMKYLYRVVVRFHSGGVTDRERKREREKLKTTRVRVKVATYLDCNVHARV